MCGLFGIFLPFLFGLTCKKIAKRQWLGTKLGLRPTWVEPELEGKTAFIESSSAKTLRSGRCRLCYAKIVSRLSSRKTLSQQ